MRKGGAEAREAGKRARQTPGDCGGDTTDLGNVVCRRRGHRFQIEEQPCEDDGQYVAVCASFGLTVSEAKTETMCLMTKRMDRVTFVTEAAG